MTMYDKKEKVEELEEVESKFVNIEYRTHDNYYKIIRFENLLKLKNWLKGQPGISGIEISSNLNIEDMSHLFENMTNLQYIRFVNINLTHLKNARYMCKGCISLQRIYIQNLNLCNLIDIEGIFSNCISLDSISVESGRFTAMDNLKNCSYAFYNCKQLTKLNLNNINIGNLITTKAMFANCINILSIEGLRHLQAKNIYDVSYMFYNCKNINSVDLENMHAYNTDASKMFYGCTELESIDISNLAIANANNIISKCTKIKNIKVNGLLSSLTIKKSINLKEKRLVKPKITYRITMDKEV